MTGKWAVQFRMAVVAVMGVGLAAPVQASLGLDKVIVDLGGRGLPREDLEVFNSGNERLYVSIEPARIDEPGTPRERRVESLDPAVSGLLATPQKLILEPAERKLVRIAYVGADRSREVVYRVAIKPVAGSIRANTTALKVFVGYDVLVTVRPVAASGSLEAKRATNAIAFRNSSNTNVELSDGKQCDAAGTACTDLPPMRIYAGGDWQIPLRAGTVVRYAVTHNGVRQIREF